MEFFELIQLSTMFEFNEIRDKHGYLQPLHQCSTRDGGRQNIPSPESKLWIYKAWNFPCCFHILGHCCSTKYENNMGISERWILILIPLMKRKPVYLYANYKAKDREIVGTQCYQYLCNPSSFSILSNSK